MKSIRRLIPWILLALIVSLGWRLLPNRHEIHSEKPLEPHDVGRQERHQADRSTTPSPDEELNQGQSMDASEIASLIQRSMAQFEASPGTDESLEILQKLRAGIRSADAGIAASAINDFLKSGRDAPTRLPFAVGPGGIMDTAPTLRTALLDLLPSLDPVAALDIAREIMDLKKSPDEFALALRNLAWNDLDGDLKNELGDRLKQMIETKDWRLNPSAGFLEALDAAVEIADARSFDGMLDLSAAKGESPAPLARASFIALDRMVVRDPSLLVASFNSDPQMSGISPTQRASLMSRLDLTDPVQREVFSRYLASTPHGEGELEYFADLFPNGNSIHGNWLISSLESAPSIDARMQSDRKILVDLDQMIAVERDKQVTQSLVRIRERLQKATEEKAHE